MNILKSLVPVSNGMSVSADNSFLQEMIIVIRHANDEDHEQTFVHDYHLQESTSDSAKVLGKKLRRRYGRPDKVFCSPFRRTITTSELLRGKHSFPIEITRSLGRYFTKKNRRHPDVAPRTLAYGVDVNETKEIFRERVDKFCRELEVGKNEVVWIVTHAYTFKRITKNLGYTYDGNIDFLQYHVFS